MGVARQIPIAETQNLFIAGASSGAPGICSRLAWACRLSCSRRRLLFLYKVGPNQPVVPFPGEMWHISSIGVFLYLSPSLFVM